MRDSLRKLVVVTSLVLVALPACSAPPDRPADDARPAVPDEPPAILLTWQEDPTTTITIDWHTPMGEAAESTVRYRRDGRHEWGAASADTHDLEIFDRRVHRAEITGLEPDTTYEFRVGTFAHTYRFRTMPAALDDRPVVFATGGDTQHLPVYLEQTNRVAMRHDLDFVVWGGDLAYANAGASSTHQLQWTWWFETNRDTLITDDGRVVPIVVSIGNHEVLDGYYTKHEDFEPTESWRERIAPYFYGLFAFPGHPGYGALDFGDYLSLIVLDSGHTSAIAGEQADWLDRVLSERRERGVSHLVPVYHIPAFPSHRAFEGELSAAVREHWVPLFETYGVEVAFENHDHAYKRTHPIRGGEVDPDGVVYLGDGAWGVSTRSGNSKDEWYIDQFASERHAIIVTLGPDSFHAEAITDAGATIDEFGDKP